MIAAEVEFFVPVQTTNESNGNMYRGAQWLKRKKRAAAHVAVESATRALEAPQRFPMVVRLTRLSAGTLDDDGLRSACKAVRDAVAKWLGVDDGDVQRLRFKYEQERCKRGEYGVRVAVFPGARLVEAMEQVT